MTEEQERQEIREEVYQEQAVWAKRWPKHCPECEGRGGTVTKFDPSPAGVSLSPGWMVEFDLCPACQCSDPVTCPRCGVEIDDWQVFQEDEMPCPHCGWAWGDGIDDTMPSWEEL